MAEGLLFVLLMVLVCTSMASDDWTAQCNKCKCVWAGGKKTADCTNINLSDIPTDLSAEIRELDFSNNAFYALGKQVFVNAELRDIHKVKLQNCSVESVDKFAFKGLLLLIELDLSWNAISALDKWTFRDNIKLRTLTLSHNRIKRLEEGLFYNLTHLQKIFLNNNEIESIDEGVFVILPALYDISLKSNRLKTIKYDFTTNLPKLNSLSLGENPWICDCHLQEFRAKTIKENWITANTDCEEPARLRGRSWTDSIVFACLPQIIEPLASTQIEATTSNVTLTCRVIGDPQPDVDWVSNGRILDKDPRPNSQQRFITSKRKVGAFTYNNLTITNINSRDRGEYKCVAKNPGGQDEKNISLVVSVVGSTGGPLPLGSALPLIIGLSVGAFIVLVVIVIIVCCCCKRDTRGLNAKRRDLMQNSSDECIRLHHGQSEIEKALITDVNPVIKPPRVCSVPPSVNSAGTEVSEVKKNLLDNDSVFAGDEESRSLDFELQTYRKPQTILDPEYRTIHNHPGYPPDLLPFPPTRMCQVSPAGSSASTVADTSRLPAHHGPQSPLHSPIYDSISLYRTLPYSRSQSPFVGAGPQCRIPRQGYVTIPRRPRQSWSSEPPTSDIGEPLYDNLGLRTTAEGHSALSLNKLGCNEASTPKSARMFPQCDPIAENDPPAVKPQPQPITQLSPSRTNWAKANAEALRTPPDSWRNSMAADGKVKVAPVPPPKPKKRTSTGPLFEDEGEDGTEV